MKTYHEWIQAGRFVRNGERGQHELVSPDGTERVIVFAADQTEALEHKNTDGWTLQERTEKVKDTRPKIKVRVNEQDSRVEVWCGPSKKAIAWMRENKFQFDPTSRRWCATRPNPNSTAARIAANKAYRVELES